jgi:hypothetical protein
MMEIWIRSIARAGGVDMPASARVLEPRLGTSGTSKRGDVARFLRRTAQRLVRVAERIDRAPPRTAPCG